MEKTAIINNRKINYCFLNESLLETKTTLLIFLHEGLGSIAQWKDFPQQLADKLKLPALVYDRYGYGKSDKFIEDRGSYYLEDEGIKFLPEMINKLGYGKDIILIGHSDGGSIALIYGGEFPENVKSVIVEAPHVVIEEISQQGIKQAVQLFQKSKFRNSLEKYHGDKTESMFYAWANPWLSEESKTWSLEKYLKNITAPVLFIQGEDDQFGSEKQLNIIKQCVKGSFESHMLTDCGHIPHLQANEEVLEIMYKHIKNMK